MRELLRLLLQPFLFGFSIAKNVLVGLGHGRVDVGCGP
jgi:hypothetical protein